ncbi:GNAT family N-acetyltransferase [Roseomonas sp. CCTCC AB2023176]|uniref:GNAT family N-acetyltransferase n=1 Tax=Roseomonas sp. CCTCC AB2023176 TaxID=3342640 RepID=UPI0035D752E2
MTLVRPAVAADLDAMLALYRHLNDEDPPPDPAAATQAWDALIGSDLATVLVAEDAGRIAASCTLVIVPNVMRLARPYALIENVVTHADHRRRGLGRAVVEEAIRRADAAGCYKVMLATGARSPGVIEFYESVGMIRTGKTFFEVRRPLR